MTSKPLPIVSLSRPISTKDSGLELPVRKAYDSARYLENKAFRSACYAPFVSLFFTTQGKVLACCKNGSFVLGDIQQQRLRDIWNGEKTEELRQALREYRFDLDCGFCEWEIKGGNYQTATPLLFDEFPVQSPAPEWPVQIEFEGSNTCNFACIMCNGDTSSSIRFHRDGLPPLARAYSDEFFQDLRAFLPHLKRARFFGGEPFLTRESRRVWEMMIEDGLSTECHVTTNGSQYNQKVERMLEALPFFLVVSIDGATKETVEKIRVNCRFEQLIENIHHFQDYTRRRGTTFHLAFCLMRQNWHEFGDLLLFAEDLGVEVWVNTVIDPSFCSLYTLPRQELARIAGCLEKQGSALADQLRLNRRAWEEALLKLRSAANESQPEKMKDVLSRYYVPDDPVQKASKLIQEGRYSEALDMARTVPEKDPCHYYALDLRGCIRGLLGDLEGAEQDLNRARKLSQKRPEAFLNMARVRLKQNRLREARDHALRAAELVMKEDRVQYEVSEVLAFIFARQGRIAQALKALMPIAKLQTEGSPIQGLVYPNHGLRASVLLEVERDPGGVRAYLSKWIVSLLLWGRKIAWKMKSDHSESAVHPAESARKSRESRASVRYMARSTPAALLQRVQLAGSRIERFATQGLYRKPAYKPFRSEAPTKVTVIITTYNHERFIHEALDSVLMQETSFDYDVVIIEDCSTDRTREIVIAYQKAHPEKLRLVLSEINKCNNSEFMRAIQESPSPYIAILDGDDYWTSRDKLQKQVDYLDRHPECTISFHNVSLLDDDGSQAARDSNPPDQKEISGLEDLIEGCFIQTCSTMIRRSALGEFPSWYLNDQSADWSLFILAAQHGKIGYINDVMGVYRQHSGGFWTSLNRIEQLERIIQFYDTLRGCLPAQYTDRIETARARHCQDLALERERLSDRTGHLNKSQWLLRVAGGNAAHLVFPPADPNTMRIAIKNAVTKTRFDVQLNQPRLKVQANQRYRVQFHARADRPRSLFVGVAEAHEPWMGLGIYQQFELTSEWQSFEQEFVATADEDNARIHFDVGGSDVSVELTSVSLRCLPDGLAVAPDLPPMATGDPGSHEASLERSPDARQRSAEESQSVGEQQVEPAPLFGEVQFGTLRRVVPISRNWGFDRGLPVDRSYIEHFLACHAEDIRGCVLEIGNDAYTRKFGGDHITRSDVLHVAEGNPEATIVADLTDAPLIPSDSFDCIIFTQALQCIYDARAAMQTLYRILKPGGVLLATVPGPGCKIDRFDMDHWGDYWRFTDLSVQRLFEEVFPAENLKVEVHGNVLAAISFQHGLAAEELRKEELDYSDPDYQVLITVRAVKASL